MQQRLLIIGGSYAASELASHARECGFQEEIVLVSDERELPYHRPPLSKAFLKNPSDGVMPLKSDSFYSKNAINLELGTRVVEIDPVGSVATLSNGMQLAFKTLALTVGARNRKLPTISESTSNVFYLRSIEDALLLRAAAANAQSIVIVGAGFIGLEVASALAQMGKHVTVVESAPRVLARAVAPGLSDFLLATHARHGVKILTSRLVKEFLAEKDSIRQVVLADGLTLDADLVVVGIGSIPNTELASQLGIACSNGIVVDSKSRTSIPHVYAAGDCTNFVSAHNISGIRLESVQNATDQARVAAASIAGLDKTYDALPWFWSDQYNLKLQIAGLTFGADEKIVRPGTETEMSTFHFSGEKCICVESVNRPREHMAARRLLSKTNVTKRDLLDCDYDLAALLKRHA